jgi:hypothetical protein
MWCRGLSASDVGMAVPENGVGGSLGMAEQLDVRVAVPKLCYC